MTPDGGEPARHETLEVPTAAVPTSGSDRRRAHAALAAVAVVVGAAIGLSVISGDPAAGQRATPRPGAQTPGPSAAAAATERPAARPTALVERLPDIPNVALPGAGRPLLVARRGTDAEILAWAPGDTEIRLQRTLADAFSRVELPQITSLAPDGRSLVVFTIQDFEVAGRDRATLVDEDGHAIWEGDGLTALSGVTWSADSNRLAVTGPRGEWVIVGRDGDAVSGRTVDVRDDPQPAPSTRMPSFDERLQPIGFSDDGAWLYGAHYSSTNGIGAPYLRVSFASGAVQELEALPALGGGGLYGSSGGRSIGFVYNASTPGGPPSLAVREADGSVAFRIETDRLLGVAFADDGQQVVVLAADGYARAGRVRLVAYDRDGQAGAPLLDVGPLTNASLLGVVGDYAAVLLSTSGPERGGELVVVRLGDGRASAIRLPADDATAVVGSGWISGP